MANRHKTSILVPSAYRPRRLEAFLASLYATIEDNSVEVLVSCVEDDAESIFVAQAFKPDGLWIRTKGEYENGAIWAFNELARRSTGDVLADMDDDQICHPHWLSNALAHLDRLGGCGLVAFNDLCSAGNVYAAHFIVSRSFLIQHMGGVLWPPMYRSWWCDREMSDKAQAAGLYAWAIDAIVEHQHWSFGLSDMDTTYISGKKHHDQDRVTYERRKAAGYPIDYKAILLQGALL